MGSKNSKYNDTDWHQRACGCKSACDCEVRDNFHRDRYMDNSNTSGIIHPDLKDSGADLSYITSKTKINNSDNKNNATSSQQPPPYEKLTSTPLTADMLVKERAAFIDKRAQFYEKIYSDSCEKIINYINKKMRVNLSKKSINVDIMANDPDNLIRIPQEYYDYNYTYNFIKRISTNIKNVYNTFYIEEKVNDNYGFITLTINFDK